MLRLRSIRRWLRAVPALLLVSALALTLNPSPASAGNAFGWTIQLESRSYDSGTDLTTFTWILVAPPGTTGEDLQVSHILIDTCLGDSAVSVSPPADEYRGVANPNPPTGTTGYKWETGPPAAGDTFSLTFAGNVPLSASGADWTVKKGAPEGEPSFVTGTTGGPECVPPPEPGSLTVVKDVVGGENGQDFEFVVTGLGDPFMLDDLAASDTPDSKTFTDVPAGTYIVAETGVPGWTLTSVNGAELTEPGALSAVVEIAEGGAATVTFHNTVAPPEPATLTVVKDVVGGENDQDFEFTITELEAMFVLDDFAASAAPAGKTFTGVPAGTYTVAESGVTGWTLTSVDGATLTAPGALSATVDVPEGGNVTVTFHNTPPAPAVGDLRITKDVVGAATAAVATYAFTFEVDASDNAFDRTVAEGNALKITGEGSVTLAGMPVGTTLTITEVAFTEAGATWTTTIDKPQVTVVAGVTDVKVTNSRTEVLGEKLARTGAPILTEVAVAVVLLTVGLLLIASSRLTRRHAS